MKQKTKKILKPLVIIITVFTLMFTLTPSRVDAFDIGIVTGTIDGLLGIQLNFFNTIFVIIGGVIQLISAAVANVGGGGFVFLQLDDIIFNEVPILNINFFAQSSGIVGDIRANIAGWYYALRNIAIIISLVILIYVGIRMAISTIAEDKARYKKMLTDWIVGFITIFLIHYIIVITVNINDLLVGMFTNGFDSSSMDTGSFAGDLALNAINRFGGFIKGFTSGILYVCLTALILMFLISYLKRMLTIAFLIIIAPIITVTYSIDKMGDRKITSLKYMAKRIYI